MENIKLYKEANDRIADLLLLCEDNTMCLYAGTYIKSLEEKIKNYEDLEEQNRLLKLPCKAGQKVCLLRKDIKTVIDGEITSIRIGEFASDMKIFIIDDNRYTDISFDKIGDIVFFTREDAEAALKELERGKGE